MQRFLGVALLLVLGGLADGAEARNYHHGGWGHHHHGFHGSFGLHIGDPFWWGYDPWFDRPYYPYAYTPPAVIIERQPPVYIQRPAPAAPATPPAPTVWYYCPSPAGYYPYVQSCTQQWVSVDPRSVPPAPTATR